MLVSTIPKHKMPTLKPEQTLPSRVLSVVLVLLALCSSSALAADATYERDLVDRVQSAFVSSGPRIVDGIEVHRICVSPLLLEVRLHWPDLSDATRAQIASIVAFDRPVLPEFFDTPDGRFRIHYSRTGTDSVNMSFGVGAGNVPNYILNCADILDHVSGVEVDTLGMRFPVSDADPRPTEDPRFDVYFQSLSADFYGLTYPDTTINNGAGNAWWATSYMVLHSDYTKVRGYEIRPFDAMAVTVAHEFHHASQWSYDAFESEERNESGTLRSFPWWLEVSATAMEEFVYDGINDYYGYLGFWFDNPNISLRAFSTASSADGLHPYASCIWAIYLVERHGLEIIPEIWEECGDVDGANTFAAFDSVLTRRGSTLREEWSEFLVWNFFTASRATSWGYDEAAQYPKLILMDTLTYSQYPVSDTSKTLEYPKSPDEFAAAYMRFESVPSDTSTTFKIAFNSYQNSGYSDQDWMVVTAGLAGQVKPEIASHNIFSTIAVPNWDTFEEVLVIATPFKAQPVQTDFDRRLGFRFEVADTLSSPSGENAIRKISSNPLVLSASGESLFKVEVTRAEAVPVTLRIYTLDGKEVRGGEKDDDATNRMYAEPGLSNPEMTWNGTTSAGANVATGVYLALVQIGDYSEVVKVAVKNQKQ